jgi:hypothetical protein
VHTEPMTRRPEPLLVGWREWVALPVLTERAIVKAKIDTGALTSALHAPRLSITTTADGSVARFLLHPAQRTSASSVWVELPVHEFRTVRSSNGHQQRRPAVVCDIVLGSNRFPVEFTLADRSSMGFRMLLGRSALRRRFYVDPGHSYLRGQPADPKDAR